MVEPIQVHLLTQVHTQEHLLTQVHIQVHTQVIIPVHTQVIQYKVQAQRPVR